MRMERYKLALIVELVLSEGKATWFSWPVAYHHYVIALSCAFVTGLSLVGLPLSQGWLCNIDIQTSGSGTDSQNDLRTLEGVFLGRQK